MTKFIHHAPARVTVSYGADWTPLALLAVVAGACVYFATLIASILAAALVAMIAVAAASCAVLLLVLRRNGLRTVTRGTVPVAQQAVTARVVPGVGAARRQAVAAPANHLHIHVHGASDPEAVLRAITDAVPQRREESR
jgi:hypothetical protein